MKQNKIKVCLYQYFRILKNLLYNDTIFIIDYLSKTRKTSKVYLIL